MLNCSLKRVSSTIHPQDVGQAQRELDSLEAAADAAGVNATATLEEAQLLRGQAEELHANATRISLEDINSESPCLLH